MLLFIALLTHPTNFSSRRRIDKFTDLAQTPHSKLTMADLGFSSSDSEPDEPEVPETTTEAPPTKKIDVRSFIDDAAEDSEEGSDGGEGLGEENEDYVKVRVMIVVTWNV